MKAKHCDDLRWFFGPGGAQLERSATGGQLEAAECGMLGKSDG